ncbi:enolase C-terminal domain-like protein, partial [Stenotrophomonas maltophilia]|uniref:enolase C-terminal domain-like protein n=1 Tax=Stenotrophomonas maltophilia TaxID=40324 RepID=UPI0023BAA14C
MPALAELGVALIEQPLPADDMDGLALVTKCSRVPVMIDEGAFSNAEIARAGQLGAGNVLSLKLVKSGG